MNIEDQRNVAGFLGRHQQTLSEPVTRRQRLQVESVAPDVIKKENLAKVHTPADITLKLKGQPVDYPGKAPIATTVIEHAPAPSPRPGSAPAA